MGSDDSSTSPAFRAGSRRRSRRDLDDPVTEKSLGFQARHRVFPDAIGELAADSQVDPDLAARLGGKVDRRHPPDLHTGQAHSGALA